MGFFGLKPNHPKCTTFPALNQAFPPLDCVSMETLLWILLSLLHFSNAFRFFFSSSSMKLCQSRIISTLFTIYKKNTMVYHLFIYYWIWFVNILMRIFAFIMHQRCWPIIFFFCRVFSCFWQQGMVASLNVLGVFPSPSSLWNCLRSMGMIFPFGKIPLWSCLVLNFCFLGSVFF